MKVVHADHIGEAFKKGVGYVLHKGMPDYSRNGTVLRAPLPVTTVYRKPWQRVLMNPLRRANPFFHLMESLWMLAGRNDISFVAQFNKRMVEYSDDGKTQPAAYGHRWRRHFGLDQVEFVVNELRRDPRSRRAVITMADPRVDIAAAQNGGKDVPCNTNIFFIIRPGNAALDMTVCNRSNDAIWGCYGANVVHMTMLQEFVALSLGVPMGRYYQVSNDLHVYTDIYDKEKMEQMVTEQSTYYPPDHCALINGSETMADWTDDLYTFMDGSMDGAFRTRWFNRVAVPVFMAWRRYKLHDLEGAKEKVKLIAPTDWRTAAMSWLDGAKK